MQQSLTSIGTKNEYIKGKEDIPELEDVEWLQDLAFVVDVKEYLTNLQGKVMGHNKLVMESYDSLCAFEEKLDLMEEQLSQNDLTHFPRLESRRAMDSLSHVDHNEKCRSQILKLKEAFQSRIDSFENLEKLSSIFLNPFTEDPYEARKDLQLELIELQCDLSLKNKFSSVDSGTFYKDLESKYSNLKSLAAKILSMFGTMNIHKKLFKFLNSKTSVHFFRKSEKIWKSGIKIAIAQTLSPDFDMLVQIWKERQAEVPIKSDEGGGSSSVTDPVWSAQGKRLGRNKKVNGRGQHLRRKKKRTEQNSSDECLDGTDAEVYIDVAEHHEDSRKRKHSMDDDEELVSVSDGIKYIKSEDDVGVKIEISQEYLFDEPSGEQEVEKNRSDGNEFPSVNDGKTYNNSEYDYDNVETENSQEYLFVESLGDQDKNEVEDVEQRMKLKTLNK
ncbi:uncharacterized protein LOC143022234 isoform X2 [Oratosquilla oratoria]|uniref:uncharacterized protein LOC143022234 isoform X2 n=1 Tax=Oratosquilla oratoria TaxID=337810 RepID=UPI003F7620DC